MALTRVESSAGVDHLLVASPASPSIARTNRSRLVCATPNSRAVSAIGTPSGDMMTQAIFVAPMLGLYLLSIAIAWAVAPKRVDSTSD